jgi:hypothetical protein
MEFAVVIATRLRKGKMESNSTERVFWSVFWRGIILKTSGAERNEVEGRVYVLRPVESSAGHIII